MSSRRMSFREFERVQGRNGSVGAERVRSSDVSKALTEVLCEETRLPRALASGEGKDLGGVQTRKIRMARKGETILRKKRRLLALIIVLVSRVKTLLRNRFIGNSHSKYCPITEDPDSVAHMVRHFKPAGCPPPSLRNMTERDAYVKMVVAHTKVGFLISMILIPQFVFLRIDPSCSMLWRLIISLRRL